MPDDLISLSKIHYRYPGADAGTLCGVDLSLRKGERLALVGPNGAGKTTLLKLLVGLLSPDSGSLFAFGRERRCEEDFFEVRERTGFLFQNPDDQLFCATAGEDVAFGPFNLGKGRREVEAIVASTLERVGLKGFRGRVSSRMSGGERRLLSLACVMAMNPEILLLDEPSAGLDSLNCARMLECLRTCGSSLVIASHDTAFLESLANCSARLSGGVVERL